MIEAVWIVFAFSLGMGVRFIGLPPLIGYLIAGFLINALGQTVNVTIESTHALQHIAHLGVLLLLFTVGLKLKVKSLVRPEVLGGGVLYFSISTFLIAPGFIYFLGVSWYTGIMLAIALSFSSTVLAAKVLESKGELRAFHGRVAIGILVVQDLLALGVMSVVSGQTPSLWALVVFGIPLLRPLVYRLVDYSGHDELLVLSGLLLALVFGGFGFEKVGLSSELGALAFGALLAGHPRAGELAKGLWSIKEIFLVGFFLQIGMSGLPDVQAIWFAVLLALLLPLKGALFFGLLIAFKLRSRSAFLTSLSLTNYSEFGLIVASVALSEWLIPLALAVAFSFLISAPLNRFAHPLYERFSRRLISLERKGYHPDEQPLLLVEEVLVVGAGRTGLATYKALSAQGLDVIALDSDPILVEQQTKKNINIMFADAADPVFWRRLEAPNLRFVILSANELEAKVIAAQKLRKSGFSGLIVSYSLHHENTELIRQAGVDYIHETFDETGIHLAGLVLDHRHASTE